MTGPAEEHSAEPIAVIGLACRLPGAADAARFWRNLIDGVESVRFYTREEQAALGVPGYLLDDPSFVRAASIVDEYGGLDARFFGMSPREAELRDPQQRIFLELAHTALEDGGYDPGRTGAEVGVYGAIGSDEYQWMYLRPDKEVLASVGTLSVFTGNHPDYLATLASYKLDLRGPSITLHTACSSSLVAVHVACEALRAGECDMALTGGVSIELPAEWGYVYHPDGIYSPDGHCRAFDAAAAGTIWGSGGAMVLLKRLDEALADGDHIRAVILGNAVNNDGAAKAGFSAPSAEGQAAAVSQALGVAGVDSRTVTYVEAHGTGTSLGDPIEVAALSNAFRDATAAAAAGWCGIGSVKTNIGHLGPAAGIAGLAKAVLAIEHGLIPPSLNFERPNPKIEFGENPFYVAAKPAKWETTEGVPRRAGVSSFGIGGTNAHVVLEEPPAPVTRTGPPRPVHLLQVSARTPAALDAAVDRLADRLSGDAADAAGDLADVAFTLRRGRTPMGHRATVVAADPIDAAEALKSSRRVIKGAVSRKNTPQVAWMFSGQGAQYPGMGERLYEVEPVFRDRVDECAELLREDLGLDIRELQSVTDREKADERLRRTELTQPALFVIEYALADLWRSWGIEPGAMIGHSIGEYAAATVAGVFSLPDAARLVAARGRLMQSMPAGSMLAVRLGEEDVRAMLPEGLAIATVNGPGTCVVAGPVEPVKEFSARLAQDGVGRSELRTSHAFHSPMMEPILGEFHAIVAGVDRRPPRLPFLSNVTGEWITAEEAMDPAYWARHLRETVRFGDCVANLLATGEWLLVECGPGRQLAGLARAQLPRGAARPVPSLPGPAENRHDLEVIYAAAGALWAAGVVIDTDAIAPPGRRVPLPTYPFERAAHMPAVRVDPEMVFPRPPDTAALPVEQWFSVPVWRQEPPLTGTGRLSGRWVVFAGEMAAGLVADLRAAGADVVAVAPGTAYGRDRDGVIRLRPGERDDYDRLLAETGVPDRMVHAWALDGAMGEGAVAEAQNAGFYSLLFLVQALTATARPDGRIRLDILTAGTQRVFGDDLHRPEHATVEGVAKVVPMEVPWLEVRHIDLAAAGTREGVLAELESATPTSREGVPPSPVALRAGRRWTRRYEPVPVAPGAGQRPPLRTEGVYVITGGLGGIGITLAEDLGRHCRARLVLVGRSGLRGDRAGRASAAIGRIEAAGGRAIVTEADVTDPSSLRQVREQALERFGRIDGIVHAAGVPGGGMAEVKDRAAAERVIAPKLHGTLALRDVFGDLDLDFVLLCSSVTAVAGGFGQVDYCAANAFLDAYAQSAHGWTGRVMSVNWGSWLEVGMAAEVSAPAAFRAIQRGDQVRTLDHPVLTQVHDGWVSGMVSPKTHWLLSEHRVAGVPVIPGTGCLEIVRCAFEAAFPAPGPDHLPELTDVAFVSPLSVADGAEAEIRVRFDPAEDGADFELVSLAGDETRSHTRGTAAWVPSPPVGGDISAVRETLSHTESDDVDRMFESASGLVTFGPRWRNLRRIFGDPGEQLAWLEATTEVAGELGRYPLHPALLDEAVSFACMPGDEAYLPMGYGRITIRSALPARLWSHARQRDTGGTEILAFDVQLYDEDGNEVATISDFVARRVDKGAVGTAVGEDARQAAERPVVPEESAAAGMALDTEGRARGIAPADGADAFRRLLTVDLGEQVVVNATPLAEFVAGVRDLTQETLEQGIDGAVTADPVDAAADEAGYVAPRTELEATVAALWGEVLGAGRVGVEDDFFDLGGNSLVAVQLIGLFRKKIGVRLPMRGLFETPTVAGMAALAEEKLAGEFPAGEKPGAIRRQPRIER